MPQPQARARAGLIHLGIAALASSLILSGCTGDTPESLQAKAQSALQAGNTRAAILHLKTVLQAQPDAAEPRFQLGAALLADGDPGGAQIELSRALDQGYPRDKALPLLARALLLSGQGKRLTSLYSTVDLEDKAAQAALKSYVAAAWGEQGDRAKTEAAVQAALAAQPEHPQALVLRARMIAGTGEFDNALKIVDQVLAREPGRFDAWVLKGELLAYSKNDIPAAEAAFRKALEFEKAYLPAHSALVSSRLRASDLPGARKQADALRALLPNHPQTVFIDAYVAALDKQYPRARELVQQVLRVLPDHTSVLQLAGTVEAELGALVHAESLFGKALRLDPTLDNARRNLAQAQLRLGKPRAAHDTLKPLLAASSTDGGALAIAGEAALAAGDPAAAEVYFGRAAQADPSNPRTRTALVMTRLARGETAESFSSLKAISAQSNDTYADLALVSAHLKRGEYDAALAAVDVVARKLPEGATAPDLRGRVLATKGDLAGARAAFEQALARDPASVATHLSLNEIDFREKRPEQALARLDKALTSQPGNSALLTARAHVLERSAAPVEEVKTALAAAVQAAPADVGARVAQVDALLRAKQYKEALIAAQAADAAIPGDLGILDALGRAQALAGDTQQAIGTFRRITNIEPGLPQPHLRLAAMHRDQGNTSAAIASLRRAVELDPDQVQARSDLIDLLVRNKQAKQAVDIAREMQTRSPQSPSGYLLEGATQMRLNDPAAAAAVYRKGMAAARDQGEIARLLFRALIITKREPEALRHAESWLQRAPDDAAMHYEVGTTEIDRGNLESAEKHLRRAAALRDDHPMVLNNLAWVLATRGKPGALPLARRAVELRPNDANLLDTLATVLAAERQFGEAIAVQKRAIEVAPGEPALRLHLAQIALQANDKALARSELDRLSGLGTKFPGHAEVARLISKL
jgi:putative PEP-CTERM system TPR-repeat lipoprotein